MKNALSLKDAQKAILISQGIYKKNQSGNDLEASSQAIKSLNYVQIDSISVVERAHHHSIWNRAENYHPSHIEHLLESKQVFEYWSHAASYLPMDQYRYSLPRKNAIKKGEQHWFVKDNKTMSLVLERIKADGPLQAKDFKDTRKTTTGWWDWKPAKKALEQLFMQGDLMVLKRQGFQKVYDLTERVLPENVDTNIPSEDEYYTHLIVSYLTANAIGTPEQMSYLLKGIKKSVKTLCMKMLESGLLITVDVDGQSYFSLPTINDLLKQKLRYNTVKILSPFDNLLIQRKRIKQLFNYDYQIECYVPADKRKIGYFSLPLLWGRTFAGQMDVKMDRKSGVLNILNLHLQTSKPEEFIVELKTELNRFLSFNNGKSINVSKITSDKANLTDSQVKYFIDTLTDTNSNKYMNNTALIS